MTPFPAFRKLNDKAVFFNPKDKSEKQTTKFELGDIGRTADNEEKTFSKKRFNNLDLKIIYNK